MTTQTNISFTKLYTKFVKVETKVSKYQHLWHRYFKAMHFGHNYDLSTRARSWEKQWNDLHDILTRYHSEQFNKEQSKRGKASHYNFGDLLA